MTPRVRPFAVTVIALAHAGVLAAIVFGGGRGALPEAPGATIAVRAVPPSPSVETAPALVIAAVDPGVAAPDVEIAASAACELTDTIAAALAHDDAVGEALAATAPARSAVMVWDGHWADDAAPIRRVVVAQVRAATAECQETAMTGPRLLMVPAGSARIAVAVGSGNWRWSELLT